MWLKLVLICLIPIVFLTLNASATCEYIWCSPKDGVREKLRHVNLKSKILEKSMKNVKHNATNKVMDVKDTVTFELKALQKSIQFYLKNPKIIDNDHRKTCLKIVLVQIDLFKPSKIVECTYGLTVDPDVPKQVKRIKNSVKNVGKICKQEFPKSPTEEEQCLAKKIKKTEEGITATEKHIGKEEKKLQRKVKDCLKKPLEKVEELKNQYDKC